MPGVKQEPEEPVVCLVAVVEMTNDEHRVL